jgi:radical SAM superfamily enzyme YgiQ (UPF0313 family)
MKIIIQSEVAILKILLIEPTLMLNRHYREKLVFTLEPLSLARLAGLTPPDVEVEIFDERIEDIDFDRPCDLVGISVRTFNARRAYQIAAEFRRRGVIVILGGFHPSLLPEEAGQHADAVLVGEAEHSWFTIIEDVRRGRLKSLYQAKANLPFESVPTNRQLLSGKRYLPVTLMEITRGCPHDCGFCSVTQFYHGHFRHRPINEVLEEVRANPKPLYLFADDNITANTTYAKELFRALISLKIRWISQASITVSFDSELMDLIEASGCAGLLVGVESIAQENLKQVNKKWNMAGASYETALEAFRQRHIPVMASFIVGLDDDTPEKLDALLEFAVNQQFFAALFNMLTPFPGTQLYTDYVNQGRMLQPQWWVDEEYRFGVPAFQPRLMSRDTLAEKRMEMYKRFYGAGSLLHRVMNIQSNAYDPWHVMMYLLLNTPAYREERHRFRQPLGAT